MSRDKRLAHLLAMGMSPDEASRLVEELEEVLPSDDEDEDREDEDREDETDWSQIASARARIDSATARGEEEGMRNLMWLAVCVIGAVILYCVCTAPIPKTLTFGTIGNRVATLSMRISRTTSTTRGLTSSTENNGIAPGRPG